MTAYELRAILDRFHKALRQIEDWAENHRRKDKGEPHPEANVELHRVWCALDRECKLMRAVRTSEMKRIQKEIHAL